MSTLHLLQVNPNHTICQYRAPFRLLSPPFPTRRPAPFPSRAPSSRHGLLLPPPPPAASPRGATSAAAAGASLLQVPHLNSGSVPFLRLFSCGKCRAKIPFLMPVKFRQERAAGAGRWTDPGASRLLQRAARFPGPGRAATA